MLSPTKYVYFCRFAFEVNLRHIFTSKNRDYPIAGKQAISFKTCHFGTLPFYFNFYFNPKNADRVATEKTGRQTVQFISQKLMTKLVPQKAEVKFTDFLLQINSIQLPEMHQQDPTPFISAVRICKHKQSSLTYFFAQKVCRTI